VQQVRDLEQQLNLSTQRRQPSVLSVEEEFLGIGVLQKTPPQDRNLSYIRTIEKEKRDAFEVCVQRLCVDGLKEINLLTRNLFFAPQPETEDLGGLRGPPEGPRRREEKAGRVSSQEPIPVCGDQVSEGPDLHPPGEGSPRR